MPGSFPAPSQSQGKDPEDEVGCDEGLTLETSASESLYGGQFKLLANDLINYTNADDHETNTTQRETGN